MNFRLYNNLFKSLLLALTALLSVPIILFAGNPVATKNYFRISVSPSRIQQGQSFAIFVDSSEPLKKLKLKGLGKKLAIYRIWHQNYKYVYRSFVGVPVGQEPGEYKIVAEAVDSRKEKIRIYSVLQVEKANYKVQHISLPKKKASLLNIEELNKEGKILGSRLKIRSRKVFFANHFIRPAKGRISSRFGARRKYNDEEFSSYHKGIDIANIKGTKVKAANGGRVSLAMDMKANGKIILINHGHGITTIYSHLSTIKVKEGQWVKQGHIIGLVGSTGISSGPHLHFGFSVNNMRVDPVQWIDENITIYYNTSF